MVANTHEDTADRLNFFLAGYDILSPNRFQNIIADVFRQDGVPPELNPGIRRGSFLHNLAGSQSVAPMHHRNAGSMVRQSEGLFESRVPSADNHHPLIPEEKAVANSTG
jgi:hypothetical protein